MNKEQPSTWKLIENVGSYFIGIVKDIFALFKLEIKLAGKSIVTIILLSILTILFALSCWFSMLSGIVIWLMSFNLSLMVSLFLVSAFNLIVALILIIFIMKYSQNLHFKETRRQLEFTIRGDDETITSKN